MISKEDIHDLLVNFMESNNLSQSELAKLLCVEDSTISMWLSNKRFMNTNNYIRFINLLEEYNYVTVH